MLGWSDVPTTVVNLESIIRGEGAENVLRKDFAPSEAVAIAAALEPIEREAAKERMLTGQPCENFTQGKSLDKTASAVGMSRPTLEKARQVVEAAEQEPERFGDLVERMDRTGKVDRVYKELQAERRLEQRAALANTVKAIPKSDRWSVEVADIREYQTQQRFDFIITDPPYLKEYLPLYEVLAQRAGDWLKDGGLLLAMCGQSYLDQIYEMMSRHIDYYWTAAYLTPGQPTPLRQRQVNTTWKPILIFSKGDYHGKIFGDVFRSDGNDKSLHKWGQSESGMYSMVSQVCLPGQSILDPFCGAGTTGVAALQHGCLFAGIDIDEQNTRIAAARLVEIDDR